ncbi:MAG: hypothetical protein GXP48_02035 [Acidobacteria bacterium]|nr:hypothetical protein [Acidobacteriota bacterium]
MSKNRSFARIVLGCVLLVALTMMPGIGLAGQSGAPGGARAATARTALTGIEARITQLDADLQSVSRRGAAPPPSFSYRVVNFEHRLGAVQRSLVGLHWTVVRPLLARIEQLRQRLQTLQKRLDTWVVKPPLNPDRPLKVSAATGSGAITGVLTDEATGDPIPYTRVEVYCSSPFFDAETMTGASGTYTMTGLGTGDYYVRTWNELGYQDELYDNIPVEFWTNWTDGNAVHVMDGHTTSGISFALERLGAVRGTVTASADGSPLSGIEVDLIDTTGNYVSWDTTAADGTYRFDNVTPGSYFVRTQTQPSVTGYLDELYDNIPCPAGCDPTTGTPVQVVSGQITRHIDFTLDLGGSITGHVTGQDTGLGVSGGEVDVYDNAGNYATSAEVQDTDGSYSVVGLWPGTYEALGNEGWNSGGYGEQLYDGIPCSGQCDPTSGTPIDVALATETPNIDFSLPKLRHISGSVTDAADGSPLKGASVDVYDNAGSYEDSETTDTKGHFTSRVLHAGQYFATARMQGYIGELYQNIACPFGQCDPTTGTAITLTTGADTTGVDFTLDQGGIVAGTVTSVDNVPLASMQVELFDDTGALLFQTGSDTLGHFDFVGLPTGTYFATASDAQNYPPFWVSQLYSGIECPVQCAPATGTGISVTMGQTTQIGFSLEQFGRILGRVTDAASGAPIANVVLTLYDSQGHFKNQMQAAADGTYSFSGLNEGTYRIVASDTLYEDILYNGIPCEGGCDVNTGNPIGVHLGADTTGIDFALHRFGSISGVLTDAFTGHPIWSAHVQAYDSSGTLIASSWVDNSGHYTIPIQTAGTYYVTTAVGNYQDELYDDIPCEGGCDVTSGTPVTVVNGADTGGIDFSLESDPLFSDVPVGFWARRWIRTLYSNGITGGCATDPLRYCPAAAVSRSQMSVFLLKSKEGSWYSPPNAVGIFGDVPASSPFAPWIEEVAARGITVGCSNDPLLFCPDAPVTRRQMAVLMLKTIEGPLYTPPAATGIFNDVPVSDPTAPWIEEIARRGITAGCSANPPLFCPNTVVSRDQMAVFLVKAFGLTLQQ